MAMIPCPECKKQISDAAESCPKCGYKLSAEKIAEIKQKQRSGLGWWTSEHPFLKKHYKKTLLFWLVFLLAVGYAMQSKNDSTDSSTNITNQFSSWDGSHRGLTKIIKQSMHDPKSYEHVETVYWERGNHLIVKTTFRGKNQFGGTVTNWVNAKVDLDGNVMEILSEGP